MRRISTFLARPNIPHLREPEASSGAMRPFTINKRRKLSASIKMLPGEDWRVGGGSTRRRSRGELDPRTILRLLRKKD
jgi:hypothetical protein